MYYLVVRAVLLSCLLCMLVSVDYSFMALPNLMMFAVLWYWWFTDLKREQRVSVLKHFTQQHARVAETLGLVVYETRRAFYDFNNEARRAREHHVVH